MILIIDNFDSFTYNLVQYVGEVTLNLEPIKVVRNNALTLKDIELISPRLIIISPGPCTPTEAGISVELVKRFAGSIPILGVCLGHQSIGQAYGAQIVSAKNIKHGKRSEVFHSDSGLFEGLPQQFLVTRYHSLAIKRESLPESLVVTAWTADGEIMAIEHRDLPSLVGIQFHPESILTEHGKTLLKRFCGLTPTKSLGIRIALSSSADPNLK